MNKISTFTLKGMSVDVLYNNKNIGYTFETNGKHYGSKVELPGRSTMDIVSATFLLFENALETIDAVNKLNNESK